MERSCIFLPYLRANWLNAWRERRPSPCSALLSSSLHPSWPPPCRQWPAVAFVTLYSCRDP